jgi:hypothetical protein
MPYLKPPANDGHMLQVRSSVEQEPDAAYAYAFEKAREAF